MADADDSLTADEVSQSKQRGSFERYSDYPRLMRSMKRRAARKVASAVNTGGSENESGDEDLQDESGDDGLRDECGNESSKAPRGKHKRSRDSYVRSMRGPFPNPYDDGTIDTFRHFRFRHRERDSDTLTDYETVERNPTTVRLMIGDTIKYKDPVMLTTTQYRIVDFRRDYVVVGWQEAPSSFIDAEQIHSGNYARVRTMNHGNAISTTITDGSDVWVKRDPATSRRLIGDLHARAMAQAVDETQPASQLDSMLPSFLRWPPAFVPITVLGEGDKSLYPWSRLGELPTDLSLNRFPLKAPEVNLMDGGEPIPCLFCGESVKMPSVFTTWESVGRDRDDRKKFQAMRDHCADKHPGKVLFSLVCRENNFVNGEHYGLKDRIQWSLQQAVAQDPLPLGCVELLLQEGDGLPLRCHLSSLFGYARAVNLANNSMRKLQCFRKVSQLDFVGFKAEVDGWLSKIAQAFLFFDFRSLAETIPETPYGPRHILLWNSILLFFSRGVYMEPPFPCLLNLGNIPSDPPKAQK